MNPKSYGGAFESGDLFYNDPSENLELVNSYRGQLQVLQTALESIVVLGLNAAALTSSSPKYANVLTNLASCKAASKDALDTYKNALPVLGNSEKRVPENLDFSESGLLRMKIAVFGSTLQLIHQRCIDRESTSANIDVAKFDLDWCSQQARNALNFRQMDAGATYGEPATPGG